ncbi:phage portal protein [Streptococcus sp. A23]|uniref:phage portal protein n=1 Tax=Streptococcus sp. A23 TaxID=3373127 RepID=UPI00374CAEFE
MGIIQTIKNFFTRSRYAMTAQSLGKITEHPKIMVSSDEYERIENNVRYYAGRFDKVKYKDSNGTQQVRDFNHLPIGRTAAKKIASLVFNEQAEIKIDDKNADAFLSETLKNDRFNKNFERYLESCLALGGLAMRPYVDDDKVRVSFIQAPVFFPLQTNTQDVSSAAIVTKSTKVVNKKLMYYTLIEIHEWKNSLDYFITNELYESEDAGRVGSRVPLNVIYEDLKDVVKVDNVTRPLFTYLKPPGMNNRDINSPLGLSIFDNAKTTIDFINTTYDEFMWEVKMGQRRVAVPSQTVKTEYDQNGDMITTRKEFDVGHNVYEQFDSGLDEGIKIIDLTTPIRSDDYIKAINEGLSLFEMQLGVSAGMFTFDGHSMKTATEIVSENSDTYQMRNSIVALVEQSLKELVVSIFELARAYDLYNGQVPDIDDISINLDDGVFTDRNAELDYWIKVVNAGFGTQLQAIEKVLNVTPEKAKAIKGEIDNETVDAVNRSEEDISVYGE